MFAKPQILDFKMMPNIGGRVSVVFRRLRPLFLGLVVAVLGLAGGSILMAPASDAIVLSCKADVVMPDDQREALCRSMQTALAEKAGADRVLPLAQSAIGMRGALRITLHLTRADPQAIEGHLKWQVGDKPPVTGSPVILSVDDMPLGPFLYPSFAAGLLQVSDLPI